MPWLRGKFIERLPALHGFRRFRPRTLLSGRTRQRTFCPCWVARFGPRPASSVANPVVRLSVRLDRWRISDRDRLALCKPYAGDHARSMVLFSSCGAARCMSGPSSAKFSPGDSTYQVARCFGTPRVIASSQARKPADFYLVCPHVLHATRPAPRLGPASLGSCCH